MLVLFHTYSLAFKFQAFTKMGGLAISGNAEFNIRKMAPSQDFLKQITDLLLFKYLFRLKKVSAWCQKRRWRQLLSHGVKSYRTALYLKTGSTPCESRRLSLATLVL